MNMMLKEVASAGALLCFVAMLAIWADILARAG